MGYILRFWALFALCTGIALAVIDIVGASRAQAQQSTTSTGVVQPSPLTPTPLLSPQSSTACLVGCDTQAMNCQNTCVVVGASATLNPAPAAPCNLNCTTQQLVCKQACSRQ